MKFTQYLFYSKTRTKLVAFRLGWFGFDKGKRKKIWYIVFPYFSCIGIFWSQKTDKFSIEIII